MNSIFLNVGRRHKRFLFSEILYVEASKNYVRIHSVKGSFVANYTLKDIEDMLPSTLFYRIHKSYIAAIDKITEFDCETVIIEKLELPLGIQYATLLKSKLNVASCKKKKRSGTRVNNSFSIN